MKKLYKYIVLVIGILAFSACADDELVSSFGESGNDVILSLNVQTQAKNNVTVSRAAADEKLYDLHFYVFNRDGELTGYEKLVSESGDIPSPRPINVKIRTKTGVSYIYAVANINKSANYFLSKADNTLLNVYGSATINNGTTLQLNQDLTENLKEAIAAANDQFESTEETFLEKFLSIPFIRDFGDENALRSPEPSGGIFIMSGYLNDGESVTIDNNGGVGDDNIIKLYRIVAKNTLTISTSATANGTFTPKYFRLCNVPKGGVLIPKNYIGTTRVDNITEYVDNNYLLQNEESQSNTTSVEPESSYRENFGQANNGVYTITFYYPENLQTPKAGANIGQWKERETNSWTTGSKVFSNASDNAAYIEIYGDYVNAAGNEMANVSYSIHLGNFSNLENAKSLSDYNVIRNYSYEYDVKVKGVEDIRVEATTKTGQDNPYAEGLIVNTQSGTHFDVDAHYEARVITFNLKDIQDLKKNKDAKGQGMGYFVNIKTQFGKTEETVNVRNDGVYRINGDKICNLANVADIFGDQDEENNTNEADYEWIKFVKNGDTKVVSSISGTTDNRIANGLALNRYPCVYPGDSYNKYDYNENGSIKTTRQGGWLNVFELLAELYDESKYPTSGEVHYTCFIDENYYEDKTWPEYVNKDARTMLLANDLQISSDGKSIYAEVKYSISQRSIATFYQTDYIYPDNTGDLVKAFGTEIVDEEDIYKTRFNNSSYGTINNTQTWNARTSAVSANTSSTYKNWYSDFHSKWQTIDTDMPQPQPLYSSVAKACMSRNRDLDGNGTIENEEIRWYLPAVGQYRALFIGQSAFIGKDAYLISDEEIEDIDEAHVSGNTWRYDTDGDGDEETTTDTNGHEFRTRYHYFTCSGTNEKVFWPEEGLTNNPMSTGNWGGYSWAELVRCVRTLESEAPGLSNPEKYYTYSSSNNTFDLGGIIETRNFTNTVQIDHNETQKENNLVGRFKVAKNDLTLELSNNVRFESYYNSYSNGVNSFKLEDITGLDPVKLKSGESEDLAEIPDPANANYEVKDLCKNYAEEDNDSDRGTWRTPNQKEFALMLSEKGTGTNQVNLTNNDYGTRTRFTGCDKNYGVWHNTAGIWASSDGRLNVGTGYENGVRIRCVKDVR